MKGAFEIIEAIRQRLLRLTGEQWLVNLYMAGTGCGQCKHFMIQRIRDVSAKSDWVIVIPVRIGIGIGHGHGTWQGYFDWFISE